MSRSICVGLKLLLMLALAALAGCATPGRVPAVPVELAAQADTGIADDRYLVTRDTRAFVAEARESARRERASGGAAWAKGPPPANYLAISGGGDDGAFGAGLLVGWTAAGTRPEFKLVTGVSTGALIAPFAFLGPRYDNVLKAVYTEVTQRDIFSPRNPISGFFGDAMTDTAPLRRLIGRYVDRKLLDEIAGEYAKGRLLMIGTTNLDTPEPVIWNMTAIAASKDPRAIDLFRRILVASSAIPGAFPPVMIDVEAAGHHYQEMHVDGGAMAQVFAYPPSIRLAELAADEGVQRERRLYVIRNARLDPAWATVQRRTLPIASRAVSSLLQTQGIGDLYRIYVTTQRDGVDFNLAYVPKSFTTPHTKDFDTAYMRALYQVGYDMALAGYPWQKEPPGYSGAPRAPN
jgi:predicted acylesterase/phospholipase RssA